MWFFAVLKAALSWSVQVTGSRDSLLAVSWSNGSMIWASWGVAIRRVL